MTNRIIHRPDPEKDKEFINSESKKFDTFLIDRGGKALVSKAKLHSQDIEELKKTNLEEFAVELCLICIDILFFADEENLKRLKELGISNYINKFFIPISKISEAVKEVIFPQKKEQKQFILFLGLIKTIQIIESHAFFNIINLILKDLLPITQKTGNQSTPYNYFTSFIHKVKKRKGTFNEVLEAFQNIDGTNVNSKKSQKTVERLVYKYYCLDSIDIAKLSEGRTGKIILSNLLDHDNSKIISVYEEYKNPDGFSITEKDIIMRFYPILNLVLPGLIKDDDDFVKRNAKQKKVAHSKVYQKGRKNLDNEKLEQKRKDDISIGFSKDIDDHNIENIKSKLFGTLPKKSKK